MGHPLGPGRSGSWVVGVTDQAIKPTMMVAGRTPVTKRGELKKDILKTGGKGGNATADDVVRLVWPPPT